ncbi:MAG: protein translocase subunit SecF [Candidatus Ancillula sp.]|jgi:preprotein translocase subunit SecF|nr:protein translocase subunit SecF [Candidatus Ancillula sp.]
MSSKQEQKELHANRQSWGNALYTGAKSYDVVGHRWKFFTVSLTLCALCILAIIFMGLNLGIDFKGGTEFTISGTHQQVQQTAIDVIHEDYPTEEPSVSSVGNDSVRVQTGVINDQEDVNKLRDKLASAYGVNSEKVSNTAIGPTWGASVGVKALQGLVVFLIACALFMTVYFRSWRMALSGIIALIHDLVITIGIYAVVGWEITPASMIGFLTILGYSMYDTVVVFDKVRENTKDVLNRSNAKYSEQANLALNQTLVRSINTSVVALLPIGSILFFGAFFMGAGTLRDIALALFVGMAAGAYSSIFLATPMEVAFRSTDKNVQAHNVKVDAAREELRAELEATGQDASLAGVRSAQLLPGKRLPNVKQPTRKRRK